MPALRSNWPVRFSGSSVTNFLGGANRQVDVLLRLDGRIKDGAFDDVRNGLPHPQPSPGQRVPLRAVAELAPGVADHPDRPAEMASGL